MIKCDICDKKTADWRYEKSVPLPISKSQEMRGCPPSGDILLRVCNDCEYQYTRFHNPEFPNHKSK